MRLARRCLRAMTPCTQPPATATGIPAAAAATSGIASVATLTQAKAHLYQWATAPPGLFKGVRRIGGVEEDRTPDLGIANAALSQLSYHPPKEAGFYPRW